MEINFQEIISLAKRRGFVYPSSEIYGGLSGEWDYGPLGFLLKENIKREWWNKMLKPHIYPPTQSEKTFGRSGLGGGVYPLDSAIILSSKVWEASGHLKNFSDALVECKKCHERFRADNILTFHPHPGFDSKDLGKPSERAQVIGELKAERKNLLEKCPNCGGKEFTTPKQFNLMFKTHAGPVEGKDSEVYLRPETAQGIFINFKNVVDSFHPKLPFGIAQIGKAFRNEITPRNFLFRSREFEQMELEYFGDPKDADRFFKDIRKMRMDWFLDLGINKKNIRFKDYGKDELAHYSKATTDIEYRFGLTEDGFSELEGIANRTDFDLKSHFPDYAWVEGEFIPKKDKSGFVPYVIEPSLGVDRAFLAFLLDAYEEEKLEKDETRTVLHLHPRLAPYKAAVFPLLANKSELVKKAREVYSLLTTTYSLQPNFMVVWDERGNIGKRYRTQDEAGTPYCITVDFDSLEKDDVTVRDRDSMKQERVKIKELKSYLRDKI